MYHNNSDVYINKTNVRKEMTAMSRNVHKMIHTEQYFLNVISIV